MSELLERVRAVNPVPTCAQPTIDDVWRKLQSEPAAESAAVSDAGARSGRRRRMRLGLVGPAFSMLAAVGIAVGALVVFHPRGHTDVLPPVVPGSRVEPPAVRPLAEILGVLRRPQTPADLTSPLLGSGPRRMSGLFRVDARRATTTRGGQAVFVIPGRTRGSSGDPTRSGAVQAVLAVGPAAGPYSRQDIESGRASFSDRTTAASSSTTFVLVPDGVARVVLISRTGSGSGSGPGRTSARVHGNVAILDGASASSPQAMRWYNAAGAPVAIGDYPNPKPHYPVNRHGQTYGTAGAARSPAGEPDLILVSGRRSDGSRVEGYVRKTQLNAASCGRVKNPRQAVACSRRAASKPPTIPVYRSDGTTQIATFTIG